jgi:RNase H-fold protein (predicted Holliday junction resolvase)
MSNEDHKLKHSKRIYKKETKIKRQVNIAKEHGLDVSQPHKFIKHNALNCGNPNCIICGNPRKIWGEKTMQEKKFEERLNE